AAQAALELPSSGRTVGSRDPLPTITGDNTSPAPHVTPPTASTNPFDSADSDQEDKDGEPSARADVTGEDEEQLQQQQQQQGEVEAGEEEEGGEGAVDIDDLEALLGGGLVDRLTLMRERSRHAIAIDSHDATHLAPLDPPPTTISTISSFTSTSSSRAADALNTLATLKQLLLDHMGIGGEGQRKEEEEEEEEDDGVRKNDEDPREVWSNALGTTGWERTAPPAGWAEETQPLPGDRGPPVERPAV
ncbi:hypothetical protein CRUP_033483, partial [Coryphaenoides rupestris]